MVGMPDHTLVLLAWGTNNPDVDLNYDGFVGQFENSLILILWGLKLDWVA